MAFTLGFHVILVPLGLGDRVQVQGHCGVDGVKSSSTGGDVDAA
jgi:hypothetical protein